MTRSDGAVLFVVVVSSIMFGIIYARLGERRDGGRSGEKEQLSQLGKAIYRYTQFNDDRLPPSLWSLHPDYLNCPRFHLAVMAVPEDSGDWFNRCIYLYPGGADSAKLPADTRIVILPYETYRFRDGSTGAHTLYLDGRVTWEVLRPEQMEQILSNQPLAPWSGGQRP